MKTYTVSQAARILGVPPSKLQDHIRAGRLKTTRIQKFETRIVDSDLQEYRKHVEHLGDFALVGDGCEVCHLHSNLPIYKVRETKNSVELSYKCERCGHEWETAWEKRTAKGQIAFTLAQREKQPNGR
jgi:excisionase family DNA binding protein